MDPVCCAGCLPRGLVVLEGCALNFKHAVKCYLDYIPNLIFEAFNWEVWQIFYPFLSCELSHLISQ